MSDEKAGERDLTLAMEKASEAARAMTSQLLNIAEACLALGMKAGWPLTFYGRAQANAECAGDLAITRKELERAKKDFEAAAQARDELGRLLHEAEKREVAAARPYSRVARDTAYDAVRRCIDEIADETGELIKRVDVEWRWDSSGAGEPDVTVWVG